MGVYLFKTKIYRKIDSDLQALTFTRRSVPVRTLRMDVPGSTRILYIPTYIYNYIQNSMTPPSNQLLKVCGSIIQISGMYILGVYSLVKWSKIQERNQIKAGCDSLQIVQFYFSTLL